jgi:hypothetical protein
MQPCLASHSSTPSTTEVPMTPSAQTSPSTSSEVPMNPCLASHSSTPSPTEVPMKTSAEACPSTSAEVPMKKNRRTLTPKSLFRGLARELRLLAPQYARLRADRPALAPYATLPALIARLTKGASDKAKSELVAALLAIHQEAPHRLWSALLIRAFRPMMARLWKELFGTDGEERLALLLLSFQEALQHVDPHRDPVRIGMYVRQATRRRILVALGYEHRWSAMGFGDEPDEQVDPHAVDASVVTERAAVLTELRRPGALAAHIRRVHPSLSRTEQARIYHQLRRRFTQATRREARQVSGELVQGAVSQ